MSPVLDGLLSFDCGQQGCVLLRLIPHDPHTLGDAAGVLCLPAGEIAKLLHDINDLARSL